MKPLPSSAELALSKLEPITFGTATGFGPFETRSVTVEPCTTEAPPVGFCDTISPWGWLESISTGLPFRFALCRSASAWASFSPRTSGTFVFGGPSDEKIVT